MVSKPPAVRGSLKHLPKHPPIKHLSIPKTQGIALLFLLIYQKLQNENIIEEVKAGVYSLSGLGQMHGLWGLHKRLSGQVF